MSKNSSPIRFNISFPPATSADENGIVAISKELTPSLVLSAYIRGVFPWHISFGRVFWYSPEPRAVLYPECFKMSKSLSKKIKNGGFEIKLNTNFKAVMQACASTFRKKQEGSWIDNTFIDCYTKLHSYGFAISVETYFQGEMVGGLYGLKLGSIFFGESMFSTIPDSSKVALAYLCENSKSFHINLIDCQQATTHLLSLGATEISRNEFLDILSNEFQLELWNKQA